VNNLTMHSKVVPPANAVQRLNTVFHAQRAAFRADPYPEVGMRRAKLRLLKRQIGRYQDLLAEAVSKDFGYRAPTESKMLDMLSSVLEVNHAISQVSRWMRPSRRHTELLFTTNSLRVMYQPKGIVGVVVPWNFPIYLAMGPLVAALAAGNRVMIKLPEITPETNIVLRKLLGEIFDETQVAVFGGELADPAAFTSLPFDHIIFTGSTAIGRVVMKAAAENLTPVTLELGGKSPAIVTRNYSVQDAARRITHGKATNCGQICVAPDYALVPREELENFVEYALKAFQNLFAGGVSQNPDYTSIVNERHFLRIQEILEDARNQGAKIVPCGGYEVSTDGRRMPLHIVLNCTRDMRIMQEELFGPILPVIAYEDIGEAISFVNDGARPLALYCFSHDASERNEILRSTHSGGVTINDWGWHIINHDAPFGGVGNSGMGTYHGAEGFRELSHAKTIFKRHRFFPIQLFYPPYGNIVQRLSLRLFLGKPDRDLS